MFLISEVVAQETVDSSAVEEILEENAEEALEEIVEEKISEEDLLNMAIRKDIESSSLDELYYWAESLSLKTNKNEQSLKNILYNHYGLQPEPKKKKEEGSVKIEQAEYSTYYTVEDVDENIAEFEGRVKVIIVDDNGDNIKNNDKTHTVIADKINFNRTENSFSAIGNVEYVTQSPGVPSENIKGDSMTFNLDNWRGSILKCISEQEKEVNKEKQTFYYVTGEIKKSSSEVMGMDDVYIQTVEGSPYFNVSSTDMWMLNASDYLIFSPFVRIGHVPVLWVPFYYHTENSLYFNPLYGYDNRKGTIFNNTVYLVGKKPKKEEDTQFSFLAYNMKETTNYDMNNMTLVPNEDNTVYSEEYFKLMFDYYSKLGLYLGNSGNLNFYNGDLSLKLDSGIAFSRTVYEDGSPFNSQQSRWDKTYFIDTQVPFRYILELSLNTKYAKIRYNNYSDRFFKSDFYDRGENFLWVNYFTDKLDEGVEGLTAGEDEEADYSRNEKNKISSFTWGIHIIKELKLSPEILKPFFKSSSISFSEFTIGYTSKEFHKHKYDAYGNPILLSNGKYDREVDKDHELHGYIPGNYFFYPQYIQVPLKAKINGSFFDSSFKRTVKKQEEKKEDKDKNKEEIKKEKKVIDPLFVMDSPLETNVLEDEEESEEDINELELFKLTSTEAKDNINISSSNKGLITTSLDYDLQSPLDLKLTLNDKPDSYDAPLSHDDINYQYRDEDLLIDVIPKGDLSLNFKTNNNVFTFKDTLTGTIFYRQYLVIDDQDDLLSNYKRQSTEVKNNLSVNLKPLGFLSGKKHVINVDYKLDNRVYEKKFKEMVADDPNLPVSDTNPENPVYEEIFPEWNDEIITAHSLKSSYTLTYPIFTTKIAHSKTLEPLDEKDDINTSLTLSFWDIKTTLKWDLTYDEDFIVTEDDVKERKKDIETKKKIWSDEELEEADAWEFKDITGDVVYKPIDDLSLSLSSSYNPEEYELEKLNGTVKWYGLSLKLNSKYDTKKKWDPEKTRWTDEKFENGEIKGEELFLDNIGISHTYTLPKTYFWKNRIDMNVKTSFSFTSHLDEVTDSNLSFDLSYTINIFKFLSLSIKTKSVNDSMFLYFSEARKKIGIEDKNLDKDQFKLNLFDDLFRSFNIFNEEDRINSKFNLKNINIALNYKTPDWDFVVSYDASPQLNDAETSYEWYPVYSFFVEWKPLKMVQTKAINEDDKWTASTSPTSE